MDTTMSRRDFIQRSSLAIAVAASSGGFSLLNPKHGAAQQASTFSPHAFLEIAQDETITIWVGQTNLGQGTHTGIAMIIADELEADWQHIQVKMALAGDPFKHPQYGFQFTGGSTSIYPRWELFRTVGAAAKEMLVTAAANGWNVSPEQCQAKAGKVMHPNGRTVSYGQLVSTASALTTPEKPRLKDKKEYTIIGSTKERLDIPAKVSGQAKFGIDTTIPGMCIATVVRPQVKGASPISFDENAAMAVKGVLKVIPFQEKVAICAENTFAALKGREKLNITWSEGTMPDLDDEKLYQILENHLDNKCLVAHKHGDPEAALAKAEITFDLRYRFPYVSHATLEPMNCTAHVEADKCRIWAPTQGQSFMQMAAAQLTGLPPEKIEIATTWVGGGFGGKSPPDAAIDAMVLSKAMNRPVKVMWTREDDFAADGFRPGSVHKLRAGMDKEGKPLAWIHKNACDSVMLTMGPQFIKDGIDDTSIQGVVDNFYGFENFQVDYALTSPPVRVGFWRSVGYTFNTYVTETLIDEMAFTAKKDPVLYRLSLMEKGSRQHDVLSLLAEKINWDGTSHEGRGRGVAVVNCFGSAVAIMAEVSVDRKSGKIKLHRIVSAIDCGPAVYPDAITAQMEGGAIMASSVALYEKIHFKNGAVATTNFDEYRLITMSDIPKIEVHIADSRHPIGGVGEPGVPAVAPAIANAVFAVTGVRFRELPFDTAKLVAT